MNNFILMLCITFKILPYILENYGLDITQMNTYPWGYTPIIASLLYTKNITRKILILIVPDISIILINPSHAIYEGQIINYVLLLTSTIYDNKFSAISSNLTYFTLSNASVWLISNIYPKTIPGLITCYINAIPFLTFNLISTITYILLFKMIKEQVLHQSHSISYH